MSTVTLIHTTPATIDEGVRSALQGLSSAGVGSVLIKPNFVNNFPSSTGVTTDLDLLASIIRLLQSSGISSIMLGESSLYNTAEVYRTFPMDRFRDMGVTVVNFDETPWEKVRSPLEKGPLKEFLVARGVLDADMIISVAKMKTHQTTHVTLSIKNFFGCIHPKSRRVAHMTDIDEGIASVFAWMKAHKKIFGLVDAMVALEGRLGPVIGDPVPLGLLVGGADLLSVDAVCTRVMGTRLDRARHLALCRNYGLGSADGYTILGEKPEAGGKKFAVPSSLTFMSTHFPLIQQKILNRLFHRKPFLAYPKRCTQCLRCAHSCPLECIVPEGTSVTINRERCISCFICLEACMQGALDYRVHRGGFVYSIFKAVRNAARVLRGMFS